MSGELIPRVVADSPGMAVKVAENFRRQMATPIPAASASTMEALREAALRAGIEAAAPLEGELIDNEPTSVTGAQIDEVCRVLGFDPSKVMSISIQHDHVMVIRPRRQNGQTIIVDHEMVKEQIHLRVDRSGDAP